MSSIMWVNTIFKGIRKSWWTSSSAWVFKFSRHSQAMDLTTICVRCIELNSMYSNVRVRQNTFAMSSRFALVFHDSISKALALNLFRPLSISSACSSALKIVRRPLLMKRLRVGNPNWIGTKNGSRESEFACGQVALSYGIGLM